MIFCRTVCSYTASIARSSFGPNYSHNAGDHSDISDENTSNGRVVPFITDYSAMPAGSPSSSSASPGFGRPPSTESLPLCSNTFAAVFTGDRNCVDGGSEARPEVAGVEGCSCAVGRDAAESRETMLVTLPRAIENRDARFVHSDCIPTPHELNTAFVSAAAWAILLELGLEGPFVGLLEG